MNWIISETHTVLDDNGDDDANPVNGILESLCQETRVLSDHTSQRVEINK